MDISSNLSTMLHKLILYASIIVLFTLGGGAFGYVYQTDFIKLGFEFSWKEELILDTAHEYKAYSRDEYHDRTKRGWWFGCAAGAIIGTVLSLHLTRQA